MDDLSQQQHHNGCGEPFDNTAKSPEKSGGDFVAADVDEEGFVASKSPVTSNTCLGRLIHRVKEVTNRMVPPGGHVSNIFNFASGTLGIGIVSMASGFHGTGICLSAILMSICGALIVFSFYLIGETVERSGYRYDSWELAARNLLFRGADYVVSAIMMFFQFGTMTSYVIGVHQLIEPFLKDDSVSPFLRSPNGRRLLTATVWFFGMFCLCIPRRVASLRYFSIVGVCLVIYFVFAVVARSAVSGLPHVHEMRLFASGLDAVNGLSLFIFAFLSHGLALRMAREAYTSHNARRIRAVGAAAARLEKPFSTGRMLAIDSACSVALVGVLYFVVGFFGYAYVGPTIRGSIFQYFDVRSDTMMCVAYIGILLKICVAYALSNQACRLPIYYIARRSVDTVPFWQHFIVTCCVCTLTLILGLFIPDISIVFNLLGSICGGTLAFLLPVYFVCYIGGWTVKNVGLFRIAMSALNLIAGVVAIVFGTAATIEQTVKTYG